MADTNLEQLKRVLDELFMFDRADLDFGLYRVMNVKREEIRAFLDTRLLPLVREALGERLAGEQAALRAQIEAKEQELRADGQDPAASRTFREMQERYAAIPSIEQSEAEVYAHLTSFFRRYYKEGDFISLRRYKEGVYAIPYEGEEVKLHWANADQYYIKTTEQFRDYTFLLPDGRRVHFKLLQADTPENNNRAQAGKDRRFLLSGEGDADGAALADAVGEVDGELVVRFEYRPDGSGRSQKVLDALTVSTVTEAAAASTWASALNAPAREDSPTSWLAKHVATYTAKNTFDYFIHKDLGGFLRRELDFYLKNEVLHLDDVDTKTSDGGTLERHLRTLKAIRRVATRIIEFLTSLEEFQKRLWLKKKFVVETHWCVTLDRVPSELYPEVVANDRQREKWVCLFAIDDLRGNLPPYSEPLTEAFLEANQHLVLDTSLFDGDFTERLLASIDDLDDATDGLLVQGENFQALNVLRERFREQVQCVYIDPPYNSDASPILYKNDYQHSSWLSLVTERLALTTHFGNKTSMLCVTIDDAELPNLAKSMEDALGRGRRLATVPIRNNPQGRSTVQGFSVNHEYGLFYAIGNDVKSVGRLPRSERQIARYDERDAEGLAFLWDSFRKTGTDSYREDRPQQFFPIYVRGKDWRIPAMWWDREERQWVLDDQPDGDEEIIWPVDDDDNERVWKWGHERARSNPDWIRVERSREGLKIQYRLYPNSEGRLPGTWWDAPSYGAGSHGTNLLTNYFGRSHRFDNPKSVYATMDCLRVGNVGSSDLVLDYFAGSGTTGHAVINLNREDGGRRKYVLVEMGEYFDTVLKPRVLKAVHSEDWKDGKPVGRDGVSQLIKVIRLESYDDTLNNLHVRPQTERQERLLAEGGRAHETFRDEYALRYWVEQETRGSASLLDITQFDDPWAYHLDVGQGSAAETRPATVDLVETFNYLLGLRVQQVDRVAGVLKVVGMLPPSAGHPAGEKALVLWRNTHEVDAKALDEFLDKQRINSRDLEYDVIYVNGDNHIENTRRSDETWKVRLIEDEFQRLMFETAEQERR